MSFHCIKKKQVSKVPCFPVSKARTYRTSFFTGYLNFVALESINLLLCTDFSRCIFDTLCDDLFNKFLSLFSSILLLTHLLTFTTNTQ